MASLNAMNRAGLDKARLAALQPTSRDLSLLLNRIEAHLDRWGGYVAFSGGKDSLVVLDLARQVDPEVPVAFFDSGLEYPQTYSYLADLAEQWRLSLHIIPAEPSLLNILIAGGRWDHHAPTDLTARTDLHTQLIFKPAAIAHRRFGEGELWGVRAGESAGRRFAYGRALAESSCDCATLCARPQQRARHGGVIARGDGTMVYGPIWDWHTREVWAHIGRAQLPLNPVYGILRRIGAPADFLRVSHLLDTGRLEDGRVTWLRRGWPTLFDELAQILPRIREYT